MTIPRTSHSDHQQIQPPNLFYLPANATAEGVSFEANLIVGTAPPPPPADQSFCRSGNPQKHLESRFHDEIQAFYACSYNLLRYLAPWRIIFAPLRSLLPNEFK